MTSKRVKKSRVDPDLYPFESRYIKIGGHQLHFLEKGSGDPVVMLHGNPSWSFYFRSLIQRLSPCFHCLVPDHIGMGYSDKPCDDSYRYTLSQRVQDLEEWLEAKGIAHDITLVLHDWGGAIGMAFACRHPERIKKIVLLNTAAFHNPAGKRFPFFVRFTRTHAGAFFVKAFNSFGKGATRVGVTRRKMPKHIRRAYTAPFDSWKNRIAILRFVQDIPVKEGDPAYDTITEVQERLHLFRSTPVLIAWGMKDPFFDRHILDRWKEYLPQAEVHVFEDCGHYLLEDAPEEVGDLVFEFLRH